MDPLATGRLGETDVRVTRLGLGTAPLGGWPAPVSDEQGLGTIQAAWDVGIRYFDTAPFYGYGQSETWVGQVLRDKPRDEFVLSTKVGRLLRDTGDDSSPLYQGVRTSLRDVFDFTREGVLTSLEESLERLGLDRVDIALIHDPHDHLDAAIEGAYVALDELRSSGTIGAVGTGINFSKPATYLAERVDLDAVLLAGRYTLLEQPALDDLLPLATEKGFSLIAGGVYNSGVLIDPKPGATYDYVPADEPTLDRARRIQTVCEHHDVPLMAAAIQFPLAHPSVATVVTGARTADELRQNVELMRVDLPGGLWDDLREQGLLAEHVPVPDA